MIVPTYHEKLESHFIMRIMRSAEPDRSGSDAGNDPTMLLKEQNTCSVQTMLPQTLSCLNLLPSQSSQALSKLHPEACLRIT